MNQNGITSNHAKSLLDTHGFNEIVSKQENTLLVMLLSQFKSPLVILLILASIASLSLGDTADAFFIILIVLLNGSLGFFQEYKAEKAILALKKMTTSMVRVVRDGSEQMIDGIYLVPGDLIVIEEGNKVPADCRLIESSNLEVNEASLTGESIPVLKMAHSKDTDQIFLGTIITKGRGRAIVETTGMNTKFGRIALSLSTINEQITPLQIKLNILSKQLGLLAFLASGMVFVIGIIAKTNLIEMLLSSISLAVAAVPEGLPAVITITLALGMQKMAKRKAILRQLSSIEALGDTTIIATDKTGTLTKNEMRVDRVWIDQKTSSIEAKKISKSNKTFEVLLNCGVVCNTANLMSQNNEDLNPKVIGDTTEGALLLMAHDKRFDIDDTRSKHKLVKEYPFDTRIKTMAVVTKNTVFVKGAPETILSNSSYILSGNKSIKINKKITDDIQSEITSMALMGLRIIALAYKDVKKIPKDRSHTESDLIFIGFVGISDPPRAEVKNAIALSMSAGIRTIMITGDNPVTAKAIGIQIGLVKDDAVIITGPEFEKMSDHDATAIIGRVNIFARTTPDQKLRIVKLLQDNGEIVSVTGDGVNDAPALKQANVGVAMGITGTDVAKESADMVIADDNYATLVKAVEEGRIIFDNIKSSIKYLVGCNLGEIMAVVVGMLLGWPLILTPLQLLYVNLVTDGLPAIALATSPKHESIMKRVPRTNKNIFNHADSIWLFEVSVLSTCATLTVFYVGYSIGNLTLARSLAFITLILCQQFILVDVWTKDNSILRSNAVRNKIFLLTFFSSIFIQPILIYSPLLSGIFKLTPLTLVQISVVVGISLLLLLSSEIRKTFINRAVV